MSQALHSRHVSKIKKHPVARQSLAEQLDAEAQWEHWSWQIDAEYKLHIESCGLAWLQEWRTDDVEHFVDGHRISSWLGVEYDGSLSVW